MELNAGMMTATLATPVVSHHLDDFEVVQRMPFSQVRSCVMLGAWRGILRSFPHVASILYAFELEKSLKGCRSVLDVGCGAGSPLASWTGMKIGMDGHFPSVKVARDKGTHDHYVVADARSVDRVLAANSVDAVVALDLIEHLEEKEGVDFLEASERVARRRVVIFTPNGFLPQRGREDELQDHRSGWTTEVLRDLGFKVIGIGGPKSWRGEYHRMKLRPKALGAVASAAAQLAHTRGHPESAAALLAVKQLQA